MNQPNTDIILNPKRWLILFSVMSASIMGPIDGSVVNIAMPTFSKVFNAGLHEVSWISMAYLLVLGSLILTYGRLGDMYGYRRIFLMGVVTFTMASAVCALAPNLWILVAFRAIQAVGAGMFMAMGPAIITSVFPPQERGRALGTNGMIIAVGLALGPTLGGFLLSWAGWQSIFAINIPIGILSFILCQRVVPPSKDLRPQKFDIIGAVLGFVSLGALLLLGSYGGELGWTSALSLTLGLVFIIGTCFFISHERRVEQPMLHLSLFSNKVFSAANFSALMNFMSLSSMIFLMPFYMQTVLHLDTRQIGMILTVSPMMTLILSPISGTLSDRLGTRWLAFTGQFLVALSLFLLSGLNEHSQALDVIWRLLLFGLGVGLFLPPNNSAVMGSVPRHRLGIGSGVLATVRNVGMVLGVAVSSAIVTWQSSAKLAIHGITANTLFMAGFKLAFLTGAVFAVSGALSSLVRSDTIANNVRKEPNPLRNS